MCKYGNFKLYIYKSQAAEATIGIGKGKCFG